MPRAPSSRWLGFLALGLGLPATTVAQGYRVTTLSGIAPEGVAFTNVRDVAFDASGNLYVVDGHSVLELTTAGGVVRLAGLAGVAGSADGTGSAARFSLPPSIAVAASGMIYVADSHTIRQVTPAGAVTTLAGLAGSIGSADGTGSSARFFAPSGVAVDASGSVWVSDSGNNTIRKVTPAGEVTTIAGRAGNRGNADGTGAAARFWFPLGLTVDSSGNIWVAEANNGVIRKVTPAGEVTTLGTRADFGGLSGPYDVAVDASGNLYGAAYFDHTIRRLTPSGQMTIVAGLSGSAGHGHVDGFGASARLSGPRGLALDGSGNLFVAEENHFIPSTPANNAIRKITPGGDVTTPYASSLPHGIAVDRFDNLYVVDAGRPVIRKRTAAGVVSTLAGVDVSFGSSDGTGPAARFNTPRGVVVDDLGNLYVADALNQTIRKVTPTGEVTTLAGLARVRGNADGTGSGARFSDPSGIAVDAGGTVYVADVVNHRVRKVGPAGEVTTLVTGPLNSPWGVAVDGGGNVYVADTGNHRIGKLSSGGAWSILAGPGLPAAGNVDGTGEAARFFQPTGIAVDGAGNVYVADKFNSSIRKITPAGQVTTIAGLAGAVGAADGVGSAARFNLPTSVAVDSLGNVYVADSGNQVIRKLAPRFTLTVAKSGVPGGSVTSSVSGISCGADCTEDYDTGATVTLTAVAQSQFDGWSGAGCSGTGPCTVTMDAVKSVAASFSWRPTAATVCASGCTRTTIQAAIDMSAPGDTVLVRSTYDSAAGEVFPVSTQPIRAINPAGLIRILGEVDGSGSPITIVKTRGAPADGLLMLSPGVVENLRILPGDSTRVERVITARSGNTCPGATCDLAGGLTIRNVVIDFSSTFNTGNGLDLQADDALIDKVTLKGIAGTSILLDGHNGNIQNSTLDGREAGAVRGALAIGFGAAQKATGGDCSTGSYGQSYLISGNGLTGYKSGIRGCAVSGTRIESNTLTDFSLAAIQVSRSLGAQILSNVLTQTSTAEFGSAGIALLAFPGQTCAGNKIALNKVLGRSARDLGLGILSQNCADTEIILNEVRDISGNAIEALLLAGQSTRTVIQGNTVIGGNAVGIVYTGADSNGSAVDRSLIRDNVVTDQGRDGIFVRFMKGSRSGVGAGNVVAYNTVRHTGLSAGGNAFGLISLANTAFDRNTALDTRSGFPGIGYGFYLSTSTGVTGTCNTGAANDGGLFKQDSVDPPFGNVNVNCRLALYTHNDFDGDGRSDAAVYRHSTGEWFIRNSGGGGDTNLAWGSPALDDIPAPGSYTQPGKTDVAVYRFTTGDWIIRRSTDGGTSTLRFGEPSLGDVPVPADYDGDGLTDLATFRVSTANAEWRIRRSSDGQTQYFAWGCAACADLAVPADYDGDGKADVAVYRRATGEWYIRQSSDASLLQVQWGSPELGDLPVPGRYTTASRADIGVYRSLSGEFLIRRATDAGLTAVTWGNPPTGDFPAPADYTTSGVTDIAIYRPVGGVFRIRRSTDGLYTGIDLGSPTLLDAPLTSR